MSPLTSSQPGPPQPQQRRHKPHKPRRQASTLSINPLKQRLRSLTRSHASLARGRDDSLPSTVKLAQAREVAALKREIALLEARKEKRQNLEKYHMVRFFERRKAERFLRRAEKKVADAQGTQEKEGLERGVWNARVDLNYTVYAPLGWKYRSLYRKKGEGSGEDEEGKEGDGQKGDGDMWRRVEEATREGPKALDRLRNEVSLVQGNAGEEAENGDGSAATSKPSHPQRAERERSAGKKIKDAQRPLGIGKQPRRVDAKKSRNADEAFGTQEAEDGDDGNDFFE